MTMLRQRGFRRSLFMIMLVELMRQASGAQPVVSYITVFITEANVELSTADVMIMIYVVQVMCYGPWIYFIKYCGYKKCLVYCSLFVSLLIVTIGMYYHLETVNSNIATQLAWVPFISFIVLNPLYDCEGSIIKIMLSEIFSYETKSNGSTIYFYCHTILSSIFMLQYDVSNPKALLKIIIKN